MPVPSVTLAILAGGRGTRMGAPKSGLTITGRPILEFLADQFNWPGPTLLVTSPGNERPTGHERFDAEATDPLPDQGPLRGILTALEHAATDLVAVVTVDMPAVTTAHVNWLVGQLESDRDTLAVMCSRSIDGIPRIEPFPCVLRAGARQMIARRLAAGFNSVHGLRGELGVRITSAPADWPARTWINLNRPEDLAAFEAE
jgi:molybdopterin-guanine dinucleotide biosynthesis protein A